MSERNHLVSSSGGSRSDTRASNNLVSSSSTLPTSLLRSQSSPTAATWADVFAQTNRRHDGPPQQQPWWRNQGGRRTVLGTTNPRIVANSTSISSSSSTITITEEDDDRRGDLATRLRTRAVLDELSARLESRRHTIDPVQLHHALVRIQNQHEDTDTESILEDALAIYGLLFANQVRLLPRSTISSTTASASSLRSNSSTYRPRHLSEDEDLSDNDDDEYSTETSSLLSESAESSSTLPFSLSTTGSEEDHDDESNVIEHEACESQGTPHATCTVRAGLNNETHTFVIDRHLLDEHDIRVVGELLGEGSNGSTYHSCFYRSCRAAIKFGTNISHQEYLIGKYMGQLGIGPRVFLSFTVPARQEPTGEHVKVTVIVMEQLDTTLAQYAKEHPRGLTKSDATQLCRLLQQFSHTGAIHHDLKTNNIMMQETATTSPRATLTSPRRHRFFIIDFGTTYFPYTLVERKNAQTGEWLVSIDRQGGASSVIPYVPTKYCRSVWIRNAPPAEDTKLRIAWDAIVLYAYFERAYNAEWVDESAFTEEYRYCFVNVFGRDNYWPDAGITATRYAQVRGVCTSNNTRPRKVLLQKNE